MLWCWNPLSERDNSVDAHIQSWGFGILVRRSVEIRRPCRGLRNRCKQVERKTINAYSSGHSCFRPLLQGSLGIALGQGPHVRAHVRAHPPKANAVSPAPARRHHHSASPAGPQHAPHSDRVHLSHPHAAPPGPEPTAPLPEEEVRRGTRGFAFVGWWCRAAHMANPVAWLSVASSLGTSRRTNHLIFWRCCQLVELCIPFEIYNSRFLCDSTFLSIFLSGYSR